MNVPPPSDQQARVLWTSLTALAVAILVALIGLLFWALGSIANRLSSVLLPLAVAGVIAYVLDPVVDLLERRGIPRGRAILLVFGLLIFLFLLLLGTIVPRLIYETGQLVDKVPEYTQRLQERLNHWLERSPRGMKAQEIWKEHGPALQAWLTARLPSVSSWMLDKLTRVASWFAFLVGLFLVPVYAFYFLLEKRAISGNWTRYLPLKESRWKEEAIFILRSVNDSLIVFFRGQVLVGICVGTLTALGFLLIGLPYALLLGVMTGVLGIVPYLGIMISILPAIALGIVQFGDWRIGLVILVFAIVQMSEGLIISPRIIGGRVGLHPLTIMVAVVVGTTLMGGILGGVLAIPLTAALRTLMFRYVWKRQTEMLLAGGEQTAEQTSSFG
jgi:predicted PurR-regulated permease PerM